MMERAQTELQNSYDRVAQKYAEQFRDEMSKKPFDRKMLDLLAEKINRRGVICDLGCGPGQIARYLHGCGVKACGIDLSPEMVRQAQTPKSRYSVPARKHGRADRRCG